jgi:hypothetical protein
MVDLVLLDKFQIHNIFFLIFQEEEYKRMGLECVERSYKLLEVDGWKIEKVTSHGDTICSKHLEKFGKVYKLTVTN